MDDSSREEYCIIYGVVNVLTPRLDTSTDHDQFRSVLRAVFPQTARPKSGTVSHDPALVSAVQEEMARSGLQATPEHLTKVRSFLE